jgi:hypothetical protein
MPHGFAAVPLQVQTLLLQDAPLPMMLIPLPVHCGALSPPEEPLVPDDDVVPDDEVPDVPDELVPEDEAPPSAAFVSS